MENTVLREQKRSFAKYFEMYIHFIISGRYEERERTMDIYRERDKGMREREREGERERED